MKLFPQLALVSAIAISGNAMAMQALDDESLSAATGQDGITLYIAPPTPTAALQAAGFDLATYSGALTIQNVFIHDKDGVNGLTAGNPATAVVPLADSAAGAIVLGNPNGTNGLVIAGSAGIKVDIDADSNGGDPLLNVKVALPTKLTVRTGDIGVATSNRVNGTLASNTVLRGIDAAEYNKILNSIDIELGGTELNIQLGAEAQGAMIKVAGSITNGLTITGLELFDGAGTAANLAGGVLGTTGGSIYVGTINVQDSGAGTNLTLATDIDVSANGLVMTMGGSTNTDILMNDVRLGNVAAATGVNWDTTKSIGDVEIVGLAMAGTKIAVYGH